MLIDTLLLQKCSPKVSLHIINQEDCEKKTTHHEQSKKNKQPICFCFPLRFLCSRIIHMPWLTSLCAQSWKVIFFVPSIFLSFSLFLIYSDDYYFSSLFFFVFFFLFSFSFSFCTSSSQSQIKKKSSHICIIDRARISLFSLFSWHATTKKKVM